MSEQLFVYADETYVPSQSFGDVTFNVLLNTSGGVDDIKIDKTYFTIIVKDNDTSTEVWKDHWWEGGSTPDNSDVDYFNDTINKNYLYAVSMTLSDSSAQKTSQTIALSDSLQTIAQSHGTYFANDSFEWSNIEHILSNNGYDTVEFMLDRAQEQQTIRKLTISYDTQKVTKLEYSFSDDPNSFVEYDAIDDQNINSGVIIANGLQYLYVRPTEAVTENEISEDCFNSLNNLRLSGYDNATESWKFELTPGYTSVGLTITTTTRIVTHTLYISVDPRDASSLVVVTLGEDQTPQSFSDGLVVDTGKPVYITANTDALYDNITISSDSLILSTVGNTASFNMPDNDVTINITYEQNEQVDTHTLTVVTNPANIQSNANITINGVYTSSGNYPKDEQIIIECKDSFEYENYVYTLSSNNELKFLMPDDDKTVTVSYDRKPKKLKVNITTDPDNMKETINGFSVVGDGEYNPGTLVNLSWNYNGSTDTFTYNKNKYEFVTWKIGNSSDENPSISITVTEDTDIKLIFKKTTIAQDQTYYLGDSYQKHYRFKIQYKNAQTDPIILDWYPIVYDYGVNE